MPLIKRRPRSKPRTTGDVLAAVNASRIRQHTYRLIQEHRREWVDTQREYNYENAILDAAVQSGWIELDGVPENAYRLAKLTAAGEAELERLRELERVPTLIAVTLEAASRLEKLREYEMAARLRIAVRDAERGYGT